MHIKKGLNVPISGAPSPEIDQEAQKVSHVAVLGHDFVGLKPKMLVQEGDTVAKMQPLFHDKTYSEILFTAPAAGKVVAINRGERRALESVVIEVDAKADAASKATFTQFTQADLAKQDRATVQAQLLKSGLWSQIRTRPYSKLANPADTPMAFFVNLMDSAPLAFDPAVALAGRDDALIAGITAVSKLTNGVVHVCKAPQTKLPEAIAEMSIVQVSEFSGVHPAGLVGTHIHHLAPVNAEKMVWHLDAQDVLAVGELFLTGSLNTDILISVGGPAAKRPRVLATRRGACVSELVGGEIDYSVGAGKMRVVSGTVLTGRLASSFHDYVGAFHRQVAVMAEFGQKRVLGWFIPGWDRFSTARVHLSSLNSPKEFDFSASANGSPRAMVPFGLYEEVMPLDILATQMLRAILVQDTDVAQGLGALELDEEDVALCSFVCLSKYEYGTALRAALTKIEIEG